MNTGFKAEQEAAQPEESFRQPLPMPADSAPQGVGLTGMKSYTFVDYATQGYAALVSLLLLLFHNGNVPHWPWLLGGHAAILPLVHLLIAGHARWPQNRLLDFLRHFYPVLLYTPVFCATGHMNRMFFQDYLDEFPVRCDQALFGCQPSTIFMRKLPWLLVSELFYVAYFSYYIMISGIGLALFIRNRRQFFHYVSAVSFVFYVCYLTYIILPVVGPQVLAHEVPGYALPADLEPLTSDHVYPPAVTSGLVFGVMAWIYHVFESPGAAFPSSHVAIAVCTLYFSFRYLKPIRYFHTVMVVLLCLSTIYCHYHYGVDVLAGLLTAGLVLPLGNWLYSRFGENGLSSSPNVSAK
jgi:membrane-associated phospholipid phosphatase